MEISVRNDDCAVEETGPCREKEDPRLETKELFILNQVYTAVYVSKVIYL